MFVTMVLKPEHDRSWIMRQIHSKDTTPEMMVRKLLHAQGFKYRLHRKDLPGRPDIVFSSRKKAIFVNGCFWHGHDCVEGQRRPKTNREYWLPKIQSNIDRDFRNLMQLSERGWQVLVLWECRIQKLNTAELIIMLKDFIENN